jgi:hypothetical protein
MQEVMEDTSEFYLIASGIAGCICWTMSKHSKLHSLITLFISLTPLRFSHQSLPVPSAVDLVIDILNVCKDILLLAWSRLLLRSI